MSGSIYCHGDANFYAVSKLCVNLVEMRAVRVVLSREKRAVIVRQGCYACARRIENDSRVGKYVVCTVCQFIRTL